MTNLNRRQFLVFSAATAGAVTFPFVQVAAAEAVEQQVSTIGWLEITSNNQLFFRLTRHEMGQQIQQGLVNLIAEELGVDVSEIRVGPAMLKGSGRKHYPISSTGGSSSIINQWGELREQAAIANSLLKKAAAQHFEKQQLSSEKIGLESNQFINGNGDALPLAAVFPELLSLTENDFEKPAPVKNNFQFIGNNNNHASQATAIVTGKKSFGIDRQLDKDTLVATILRLPHEDASWTSDQREQAKAINGVKDILDTPVGIAIVGTSHWAVLQAQKVLAATATSDNSFSNESLQNDYQQLLDAEELRQTYKKQGEKTGLTAAFQQTYFLPAVTQAPIEPLSCLVKLSDNQCDIFAGSQTPAAVIESAARITGLAPDNIIFHDEYSGGSFGRRLSYDYIVDAIYLAKEINQSVKVIWSREDMFNGGYHRPQAAIKIEALVDANNELNGLRHTVVSNGKLWYTFPSALDSDLVGTAKHYVKQALQWWKTEDYANGILNSEIVGDSAVDGVKRFPYNFQYTDVGHVPVRSTMPDGFLRSVGHALNIFAMETFIDEWALQQNIDPVALRKKLINNPRLSKTIDRCFELVQQLDLSENHSLGLACFANYGSFATTIAVIDAAKDKPLPSHLICVADCGIVVAPDQAIAQIEGGLLMGLSTALFEKLDIRDGLIASINFDRYPVLRISDTPHIHVAFIDSDEEPGGLGELAVPGVAPAIANAWRRKTGVSLTQLPFLTGDA